MMSQERALAAAVVERAIEDLTIDYLPTGENAASVRKQARLFFAGGGEWARSRAMWFSYLELDEHAVHAALKDRLGGMVLRPYVPPVRKPEPEPARNVIALPKPESLPRELRPITPKQQAFFDALPMEPFAPSTISNPNTGYYLEMLRTAGYVFALAEKLYVRHDVDARAVERHYGT